MVCEDVEHQVCWGGCGASGVVCEDVEHQVWCVRMWSIRCGV